MEDRLALLLKQRRKDLHLSQEHVAAAIGKSLRTYQLYEAGDVFPRNDVLKILSEILTFDLKEIYVPSTSMNQEYKEKYISLLEHQMALMEKRESLHQQLQVEMSLLRKELIMVLDMLQRLMGKASS